MKKNKKTYSHESEELNALIGKRVRITFFDGQISAGVLEKDETNKGCYCIDALDSHGLPVKIIFRKTHVEKIEDASVIHELKLLREYAYSKLKGIKPFEIRLNDRNFKVGDLVKYTVPDSDGLNNKFKDRIYEIIFITHYAQQPGYCVFADALLPTYD